MLNDYPLPINFVNCKSRTDIGLNRSFVLQKQCIVHSCSHLVLFEQPFSIIVRSAKFLCFNHFDLSTRPQKMLCFSRNPFMLSTSYNKLFLGYLQFLSNQINVACVPPQLCILFVLVRIVLVRVNFRIDDVIQVWVCHAAHHVFCCL